MSNCFKASKISLTLCCSMGEQRKSIFFHDEVLENETKIFLCCAPSSKIPGLSNFGSWHIQ